MSQCRQDFVRFAIGHGALRFGEFTLKSGRISPYFFNAGQFQTGAALSALGHFYATAVTEAGIGFDMLFGPAYKGIPLAAATAIALARDFERDVPWAFNRKEAKDHGEGGVVVGAPLKGRILIVDDVMTAGTAVRESVELIRNAGATPVGVLICLDRQEKGTGERSAVREVTETLDLAVISIATLSDIESYLFGQGDDTIRRAVTAYRERYGDPAAA
ncbi:orotate phosphoribosyltransferase [Candidatus Macondimonas diazotrophica]|jgi:orotate phosphoribosyltransferase|uniref:Orotate phosphoribosyltransferase n=1 Tax=Candidatus Macondimonas diazotrophica TaxID=2305248 RepID=A0A4Z0FA84_9GAMM|nr:orotate phosphoribosyltransferase [Candidatus Macondimonas diazotrophica]NCU00420.1 orotate phosphoribosyltransferase [Candidatus Macondimonas diazotrophica]TFZ82740.1 orotate phosphoribosyltransferase [Candidatus Macondimonas diazotrophica]HBG52128.1 orotate phosphoribosyltransferase [Gammaproteobacteria bacterium]